MTDNTKKNNDMDIINVDEHICITVQKTSFRFYEARIFWFSQEITSYSDRSKEAAIKSAVESIGYLHRKLNESIKEAT